MLFLILFRIFVLFYVVCLMIGMVSNFLSSVLCLFVYGVFLSFCWMVCMLMRW